MRSVSRWGSSALEKNSNYSIENHRSMVLDDVRVDAYAAAIRRVARGKNVLDVGTGPFMLLGRFAAAAGATRVVCVEHSEESAATACELMQCEHEMAQPVPLPVSHPKYEPPKAVGAWTPQLIVPAAERAQGGDAKKSGDDGGHPWHTSNGGWRRECVSASKADSYENMSARTLHVLTRRAKELQECRELLAELGADCAPSSLSISEAWYHPRWIARRRDSAVPLFTAQVEAGPALREGRHAVRVELHHGLAAHVDLPGDVDLIVHEILGHVASSEGAVKAIRELRARAGLASKSCVVLPSEAGTMLAPTLQLEPSLLERLLQYSETGYSETHEQGMYHARGFPPSAFLAPAQPMEWHCFNGELLCRQRRVLRFRTTADGRFDGLHLHLRVVLDATTAIDAYAQRTTWSCVYVRLFSPARAIWLAAGSLIECVCNVDARTDSPKYDIDVSIARPGDRGTWHAATFSWSGDGS
mmetsp:Transcript_30646/g.67097  ORF Transcript_30646/g.67097 Transcript_30646/m.67097 type:complete len:472 (+) Transcript_30646:995-2410(+)